MTAKSTGKRKPTANSAKAGTLKRKIGDDAVQAKTGKNWRQWFAELDKAGAKKMTHKEIVKWISNKYGKRDWWWQMVAATYEQERGLRKLHQSVGGYEISVSKTVNAAQKTVYQAWLTEKLAAKWLPQSSLLATKATPSKSIRARWIANDTRLSVDIYPKGSAKCQVVVQHMKLPTSNDAEKMKKYWGKKLDQLKGLLESN